MKIEIKSQWDSTVLFTCEAASILLALQAAIKSDVNLSDANLSDANLYGAKLSGAALRGANLSGAELDIKIGRLDFGGWSVLVTPDQTTIGCQVHPNKVWLKHTPKSVAFMHPHASKWFKRHGETVKALIKDVSSK